MTTDRSCAGVQRLGAGCVAAERSVECNADEAALPPDQTALPNRAEIVERQFEVQRQEIQASGSNASSSVRDISNAAGECAELPIEKQFRAL